MGKDGTEGTQRREPMGRTAVRLARLITADRGLVALAAMFGVRHIACYARVLLKSLAWRRSMTCTGCSYSAQSKLSTDNDAAWDVAPP